MSGDYWRKKDGKYLLTVRQIADKYRPLLPDLDIRPHNICQILFDNWAKRIYGSCVLCKKELYIQSRSDEKRPSQCCFEWGGRCRQCKKLYKYARSRNYYCFSCYISNYQTERSAVEQKPKDIDKLTEIERMALYLIKNYSNFFFDNGKYNECSLSDLLWEDLDTTKQALTSVIEKGYVHKWMEPHDGLLVERCEGLTIDLPGEIPFLIVQLNEHNGLTSRFGKWPKRVRKKICDFADINLVEVNSHEDVLNLFKNR